MKILLIEDHTPLQQQIQQMLDRQGYVCETASSLPEALEKSTVYDYDLLIVDLNLPGGSGLEVVRRMKQSKPQTAIMIISARDAVNDRIEGLDLGADDYISKPSIWQSSWPVSSRCFADTVLTVANPCKSAVLSSIPKNRR